MLCTTQARLRGPVAHTVGMKCILYLVSQLEVEGEPLWCKIGITSSTIRSRMAGIQCGNPNRIICISSHVFQNRNSASEAEKSMHRRLKNYSAPGGGEWFEYQATIDMWRVSIHEPLIALEKCEDQRKLVKPYLCRHCGDTDGSKFRKGRKTECRECQRTSNVKCGHCGTTNKASFPPGYMTECVDCKDPSGPDQGGHTNVGTAAQRTQINSTGAVRPCVGSAFIRGTRSINRIRKIDIFKPSFEKMVKRPGGPAGHE